MKIRNIIFEPSGGETIKDAISEAYAYAFENRVEVNFTFNGFQITIKPEKQ
ncbi:MAG: hypothetical protein GY928_18670 [Colwellia sp.]|nr:hypothetical protein [Colwellia sp.]